MANNRYNTTGNYNYGSTAPDIYTELPVPSAPDRGKPGKSSQERKEERNKILSIA